MKESKETVTYLKLSQANIRKELTKYVKSIKSIALPTPQNDVLELIHSLKRQPLGTGRYKCVSLFEASNLIYSDLVILFGVQQLLNNPVVGNVRLPFTEYEVNLGVKGGNDLKAVSGSHCLVGEAFNVSKSLFQGKKSHMIKKVRRDLNADYRLIIFNADAVKNHKYYLEKSDLDILYLPVFVPKTLREIGGLFK